MTESTRSRPGREVDPALWEQLYQRLKVIARGQVAGEARPDLMQPTALVSEAWLRMADLRMEWESEAHFLAMAARVMRRVLVDEARARGAGKRDGGLKVTLNSAVPGTAVTSDILDLDRALDGLAAVDARKAAIIELTYFGGMTYEQVGGELALSAATVKRDLRTARAWLLVQLEASP
ncbi:MAG: ECF-type sigma factor [Pseudomonadota bacterium]